MYGYVRPPLALLPPEESERFREMYCGLCHTLARRYGPAARWILNYDFTFLAILLSGKTETEQKRCPVHPLKKRNCRRADTALELTADESVILAWRKLRDNVTDSGPVRRIPYQGGAAVLKAAYERAANTRPDFDAAVRAQLDRLSVMEHEKRVSLDQPADTFASILRHAASEVSHPVHRRTLEQLFYHLGRWIYLIDAADDLQQDAASGNYNPVALRYGLSDGQWTEYARSAFAATLDQSIHRIVTAFELWDYGEWRPILETTFYTGLFQTGRAVLDGTFHKQQPHGLFHGKNLAADSIYQHIPRTETAQSADREGKADE